MPGHLPYKKLVNPGNRLFEASSPVGLFVIGAATVWASWVDAFGIIAHGGPNIKDVLLLLIYLELGAMVGIYFRTKHLPVRYLIYRPAGALTRALAAPDSPRAIR